MKFSRNFILLVCTTMPKYLTIAFVGDYTSRKTELLIKYTGNYRTYRYKDYLSPRFQENVQDIIVDHIAYTVDFIDVESDDDYQALRYNAYEKADCIVLCYSIGLPKTYRSLKEKWCLEVRNYAPFTPLVLVGCDPEIRNNKSKNIISTEQGEKLKLLIGAYAFIECSIEKWLGVDDVFIEAVRSSYFKL